MEAIINCDDSAILEQVKEILLKDHQAGEPGENYFKEADPVPESFYRQLEEESEKYKRGEIKGILWEDLRKEIKTKYGF
ncbi:MAG: hypothetical protein WBL27_08330 [Salinimicrobium sp.]